ncbi:MAG: hypothetical protein Alpg2KO_21440 [Alphaproteobacteria bacterium]
MIANHITDLIGNTPLLKLSPEMTGLKNITLYAKLEMMNPFGSVKDRIAWGMIKDDIEDIRAQGQTIFENSSGNTAKALHAIATTYGVPTKLITYMAKVDEVKDVIRLLGAEVEEVLGGSECFDPNDPNDPQYLIERAVKESGGKGYFPSQFTNERNIEVHYQTTGQELADDLGQVDFLIGGLGTSGTTMGAAKRLREDNPDLKCIGVCASKNDFLPGIRSMDQMWESGLFKKDNYDDYVFVDSGEAVDYTMALIRKAGVLCGPTSGANYAGALTYLRKIDEQMDDPKTAVFVVCDRVEWYTSYIRERRPELFGERARPGSLMEFDQQHPNLTAATTAVKVADASGWIDANDPMIIDIRGNLAYKMLTLPGAVNIPSELFEQMINGVTPFPKDRKLLLLCPVGEKTIRYAAYLRSRGMDAWHLDGGILGWRNEGLEMVRAA